MIMPHFTTTIAGHVFQVLSAPWGEMAIFPVEECLEIDHIPTGPTLGEAISMHGDDAEAVLGCAEFRIAAPSDGNGNWALDGRLGPYLATEEGQMKRATLGATFEPGDGSVYEAGDAYWVDLISIQGQWVSEREPASEGIYAIHYSWDLEEGSFISVGVWDGEDWSGALPVFEFYGPFPTFGEAQAFADTQGYREL